MGLGFAACESVEESLSQPVTNPQETIFNSDNLSVTPTTEVLDLQTLNDNHARAQVATSVVSDFPTGSQLQLVMEISKSSDFSGADQLTCTLDSAGAVTLGTDALNAAYYSYVTHSPAQGSAYVRFIANAVNGTETVRIGGPDVYYGAGQITLIPFDPEVVIEETYYVLSGTNGNYTIQTQMSNSGINQYDDPIFSAIVNVSASDAAAGYEWIVVPASTVAGGASVAYAPETATEEEGTLVEGTKADIAPGVISEQGPHMIKVNMYELTYSVALTIEQLYTPGDANGWSQTASQIIPTSNYINYKGYAHISGSFKFTSEPNWDGVNYGQAKDDAGQIIEGSLSTDGGAGNLSVSADALYWCQVNLANLTYTTTEITSLGIIGDFNGWAGQDNLSPSADFLIWSGTVTLDGGGWKFRANDNWDINLGGDLDNLTLDGSNIPSEAGTYTITLDLSSLPYTATLVKQ